jgi:hypothetical protein
MPRLRPKHKFKPDQLVICWQTAGVDEAIVPNGVIFKGTRLRGNHPWVKEYPQSSSPPTRPTTNCRAHSKGWAEGHRMSLPRRSSSHCRQKSSSSARTRSRSELAVCSDSRKGRRYPKTKAAEFIERVPECFREVTDA